MAIDPSMHLLRFEHFDAADPVEESDPALAMRRFGTLIIEGVASRNIEQPGRVYRVRNTAGETFALKTLREVALEEWEIRDARGIYATPAFERAFLEEYRNSATVSNIKGFPRIYGYGTVDGVPAFLMQWVEGVPLSSLQAEHDDASLPAHTVAQLGIAVLDVLDRTDHLDQPFVHRDISPSNILLRTDRRPLDEQLASGKFDLYLVDLGSASSISTVSSTFTMQFNVLRNGTPAYAAPEMLTNDIAGVDALRLSPSIDVYALCSVLYELYAGTTPYAGLLLNTASPYRTKMDCEPLGLEARHAADKPLVQAIMAGIKISQQERITRRELRACLENWLEGTPVAVPEHAGKSGNGTADDAAAVQSPANRIPISRRTVLVAAGVALAGAGVITRGFGIIDRMRGVKGDLSEYGWDELADIATQIAEAPSDEVALEIAIRYHLAGSDGSLANMGVKDIVLSDGTHTAARVIGLRHDTAADTGDVCGLSFLFDTPMTVRPMSGKSMASGGWETCEARSWLNGEGLDLLPHNLSELIRSVTKLTNNDGGTKDPASVTRTRDRLWLPSYVELAGNRPEDTFSAGYVFLADILNAEGKQYDLYRQLDIQWTAGNESLMRTYDGNPCYWWLRTPSPDVSLDRSATFFNRVGPDGNPFDYAADSANRSTSEDEGKPGINTLMPGFCL